MYSFQYVWYSFGCSTINGINEKLVLKRSVLASQEWTVIPNEFKRPSKITDIFHFSFNLWNGPLLTTILGDLFTRVRFVTRATNVGVLLLGWNFFWVVDHCYRPLTPWGMNIRLFVWFQQMFWVWIWFSRVDKTRLRSTLNWKWICSLFIVHKCFRCREV